MTDLEMTRLCAEAMGLAVVNQLGGLRFPNTQAEHAVYDPLHDDAQAMALVKKFRLFIDSCFGMPDTWQVASDDFDAVSVDLNRAIVECVAKMQQSKVDNKARQG